MPKRNAKGAQNPFYGRRHSPETIAKISASRKGKAMGNQNAKGYRHTPDAIEKIRTRSQQLWQERFANPALLNFKPHLLHRFHGIRGRIREGEWSPPQRKAWRGKRCDWCGSTKQLNLDHIIPRFLGGPRTQANSQTLCRQCHLWKDKHIDLPMWQSLQAAQGTD